MTHIPKNLCAIIMRFENKRKRGGSQFEPVRKILMLNFIVDISNNADHVERPIACL